MVILVIYDFECVPVAAFNLCQQVLVVWMVDCQLK